MKICLTSFHGKSFTETICAKYDVGQQNEESSQFSLMIFLSYLLETNSSAQSIVYEVDLLIKRQTVGLP